MQTSNTIENIAAAVQDFHKAMGIIYKDNENPFFKSKYATLATVLREIKDPLQRAGLSFVQFPENENEMTTMLMHGGSGEWIRGTFKMQPSGRSMKDKDGNVVGKELPTPQEQGSVISYQRRYALGAVLGLNIDEDDDGNFASRGESEVQVDVSNKKTTKFPKKGEVKEED